MDIPEWHDLTALFVSFVALIVSGIAAANQLASHKRPLPSIEILHSDHLAKTWIAETDTHEDVVARAMLIIIANRGHQTLFHPTVYDWTPSSVLFGDYEVSFSMPSKLEPGEVVEVVVSHSLANQSMRTFGVVWEEASLLGRNPVQMGIRLSCDAAGMWTGAPKEHWKRVGPFRKKVGNVPDPYGRCGNPHFPVQETPQMASRGPLPTSSCPTRRSKSMN